MNLGPLPCVGLTVAFRWDRTFTHLISVSIEDLMKKNLLMLGLAFLAVTALLYAGLNGMTNDHSYGFFFTFIGAITTIGLALDVVNHLKVHLRRASVRKLGR